MNNYYGISKQFVFIEVSGPDAATYLQGQISCDIHKLEPGKTMMGCCCNLKGRIQSLFYIFQHENSYIIATSSELLEETLARLKQYAIFSKTNIDVNQDKFTAYGAISEKPDIFEKDKALSSISFSLDDENLFIIFGLSDKLKLMTEEVKPAEAFNFKLIQAGIPHLKHLSYEKFLPQELNLDKLGALDFEKGCYTGQEVVARLHYRGGLKQHLCIAQIDSPEPIDTYTEIYNSDKKCIGHVVNSAVWQDQHALLAVIRDDAKADAWIGEQTLALE
jgi:tRNA-modifying protein YgfZ